MSDDAVKDAKDRREEIIKAVILERSPNATSGQLYAGAILLNFTVDHPEEAKKLFESQMPDDHRKTAHFRDVEKVRARLVAAGLLPGQVQ